MEKKKTIFNKGDFIRNKKPYKGESEYLIMDIDNKDDEYNCATMKGKYRKEPDFDNRFLLPFGDAHRSYEKVG